MKIQRDIIVSLLLFMGMISPVVAQDFMMQAWYWDYPKANCPNAATPTWANVLQGQVNSIAQGGFTYVWLPPPTNASFGQCSNGYDPRDLYDLGDATATGLGTRADLNALILALNAANPSVKAVADVIYNHRDGGTAESNPAVKDYITIHYDATKSPFPSDRFRCVLPLGGASGNGAGDYYIKISSKSGDPQFHNYAYRFYAETNSVGWQSLSDVAEVEPNGGGDCGTGGNATVVSLGRNFTANVDGIGCTVDEFKLTLTASDFDAAGDYLYIFLDNFGGYSDHRIYGIWNASAGADVVGQLDYQTYTDFNGMPSGQGGMNYQNFRPTPANASTEKLDGFWNWPWFFYDYDQSVANTKTVLFDWTKWLWTDVGFRGFRMDAVKHFDPAFVGDLLDDLHDNSIDPGLVVGEFFDESAANLNAWIGDVQNNMDGDTKSAIDVRLFDFDLRAKLKNVCDNGHDARDIFDAGMVAAGVNSHNVITFLNNHDYRDAFQPVWNDQILAYAYLLTNNQIGLPSVFYAEYFGVRPNDDYPSVNLKTKIDELINIHKTHVFGSGAIDHLNRHSTGYHQYFNSGTNSDVLIYQMAAPLGGKETIVAINFGDTALDMWQAINFDVDGDGTNNYGAGQVFNEVTSYSSFDLTVFSPNNDVNIKIPAKSYAVWVQGALLPVELLSFKAEKQENKVELSWETTNEVDLRQFEIQRSSDGHHFEKIGNLPANNKGFYQFVDANISGEIELFYRLKMNDLDGHFEYSAIEKISDYSIGEGIVIVPNPASEMIAVNLPSDIDIDTEVVVVIHNSEGQIVRSIKQTIAFGQTSFEMNVSELKDGLYLFRLEGKNTLSAKFIKG